MKKTITKRITSIITLTVFFFQSIVSGNIDNTLRKTKSKQLHINSVHGSITTTHRSGNREIIVIKDDHCVSAAQNNITKILETIAKHYDEDLFVGVEGGVGEINIDFIGTFPVSHIRREIMLKLVSDGLVSGAEYFAVKNYGLMRIELYGIENKDLYVKDFHLFRKVLKNNEFITDYFDVLGQDIARLKDSLYGKTLSELSKKKKEYEQNQYSLEEYCLWLYKKNDYKFTGNNLRNLISSLEITKEINHDAVTRETGLLLNTLQSRLPDDEMREILKMGTELSLGRISDIEYYSLLDAYIKNIPDNLNAFGELLKYIKSEYLLNAINPRELLNEILLLEEQVKERSFTKSSEKELDELIKVISIIKNLVFLELNRAQLEKIEANPKKYDLEIVLRSINKLARKAKIESTYISNRDVLLSETSKRITIAKEFYKCAKERDASLVKNTLVRMQASGKENAVLVVGGFHVAGIQQELHKRGISYSIIIPKSSGTEVYNPYYNLMLSEKFKLIDDVDTIALPLFFDTQLQDELGQLNYKRLTSEFLDSLLLRARNADINETQLATRWVNDFQLSNHGKLLTENPFFIKATIQNKDFYHKVKKAELAFNEAIEQRQETLQAIKSEGSLIATFAVFALGVFGSTVGIVSSSLAITLPGLYFLFTAIPLFYQTRFAFAVSGLEAAATPQDTINEIVDKFGLLIGVPVYIHELIHNATNILLKKVNLNQQSVLVHFFDEFSAYAIESLLMIPTIIVTLFATLSVAMYQGIKDLDTITFTSTVNLVKTTLIELHKNLLTPQIQVQNQTNYAKAPEMLTTELLDTEVVLQDEDLEDLPDEEPQIRDVVSIAKNQKDSSIKETAKGAIVIEPSEHDIKDITLIKQPAVIIDDVPDDLKTHVVVDDIRMPPIPEDTDGEIAQGYTEKEARSKKLEIRMKAKELKNDEILQELPEEVKSDLDELLEGYELYIFNAVIEGPDKFILGWRDDEAKKVYLSREALTEAIRAGPAVVKELIWHERNCSLSNFGFRASGFPVSSGQWGHYKTIISQQTDPRFKENYIEGENTLWTIVPANESLGIPAYIAMIDADANVLYENVVIESKVYSLPRLFKGKLQSVLRKVINTSLVKGHISASKDGSFYPEELFFDVNLVYRNEILSYQYFSRLLHVYAFLKYLIDLGEVLSDPLNSEEWKNFKKTVIESNKASQVNIQLAIFLKVEDKYKKLTESSNNEKTRQRLYDEALIKAKKFKQSLNYTSDSSLSNAQKIRLLELEMDANLLKKEFKSSDLLKINLSFDSKIIEDSPFYIRYMYMAAHGVRAKDLDSFIDSYGEYQKQRLLNKNNPFVLLLNSIDYLETMAKHASLLDVPNDYADQLHDVLSSVKQLKVLQKNKAEALAHELFNALENILPTIFERITYNESQKQHLFTQYVKKSRKQVPINHFNAATKEELTAIPGIGKYRADAIIAYRERQGLFRSEEDILNIPSMTKEMIMLLGRWITLQQINVNSAGRHELALVPGLQKSQIDKIIDHRETIGQIESLDEFQEITGLPSGILDGLKIWLKIKPATRNIVIGKEQDLVSENIKTYERRLHLAHLGKGKLNWEENKEMLLEIMKYGNRIRDISINQKTGELLKNTGFLLKERNLLREKGWWHNNVDGYWYPGDTKGIKGTKGPFVYDNNGLKTQNRLVKESFKQPLFDEIKSDSLTLNGYISQGYTEKEARSKKLEIRMKAKELKNDEILQELPEEVKSDLDELLEGYELYIFNAVIEGPDKFILGWRDDEAKKVYLSREALNEAIRAGPAVLKELIWHEAHCDASDWGHYKTIISQQTDPRFKENYIEGENTLWTIVPANESLGIPAYKAMVNAEGTILDEIVSVEENIHVLPRPYKGKLQTILRTAIDQSLLKRGFSTTAFDTESETGKFNAEYFISDGLQLDSTDQMLLERIITSNDSDLFTELLTDYSDKILLQSSSNAIEGRTLYLVLKKPLFTPDGREITHLRIKGIRPQLDENGEIIPYRGQGFVSKPIIITENAILDTEDPDHEPSGTMTKESVDLEYKLMKQLLKVKEDTVRADYPVGYGYYSNVEYDGNPVGFVICGMEARDYRLTSSSRIKSHDETNLNISLSESMLLDKKQRTRLFTKIGRTYRAFHDNGFIHRYPHQQNIGVALDDKNVQVILRDLDTIIETNSMSASNAGIARFYDLLRIIFDLLKPQIEDDGEGYIRRSNNYAEFVQYALQGYFDSELEDDNESFMALFNDAQEKASNFEFYNSIAFLVGISNFIGEIGTSNVMEVSNDFWLGKSGIAEEDFASLHKNPYFAPIIRVLETLPIEEIRKNVGQVSAGKLGNGGLFSSLDDAISSYKNEYGEKNLELLSDIEKVLTDYEWWIRYVGVKDLLYLWQNALNKDGLFFTGLPALNKLFGERISFYWPGIIKIIDNVGYESDFLFEYVLPSIHRFFGEKFDTYWNILVLLSREGRELTPYVFMNCLPKLDDLIIDKDTLLSYGRDVITLGRLSDDKYMALYTDGIGTIRETFKDSTDEIWETIVSLGIIADSEVNRFLIHTMRATNSFWADNVKTIIMALNLLNAKLGELDRTAAKETLIEFMNIVENAEGDHSKNKEISFDMAMALSRMPAKALLANFKDISLKQTEDIEEDVDDDYEVATAKHGEIAQGYTEKEVRSKKLEVRKDASHFTFHVSQNEAYGNIVKLLQESDISEKEIKQLLTDNNGLEYDLYLFDAVIEGPDRFILGWRDDEEKRVYLSRESLLEAIRAGPAVAKELIWHERNCDASEWGHYQTIIFQQSLFKKNYLDTDGEDKNIVLPPDSIAREHLKYINYEIRKSDGKIILSYRAVSGNFMPVKGILGKVLRTVINKNILESSISDSGQVKYLPTVETTEPVERSYYTFTGFAERGKLIQMDLSLSDRKRFASLMNLLTMSGYLSRGAYAAIVESEIPVAQKNHFLLQLIRFVEDSGTLSFTISSMNNELRNWITQILKLQIEPVEGFPLILTQQENVSYRNSTYTTEKLLPEKILSQRLMAKKRNELAASLVAPSSVKTAYTFSGIDEDTSTQSITRHEEQALQKKDEIPAAETLAYKKLGHKLDELIGGDTINIDAAIELLRYQKIDNLFYLLAEKTHTPIFLCVDLFETMNILEIAQLLTKTARYEIRNDNYDSFIKWAARIMGLMDIEKAAQLCETLLVNPDYAHSFSRTFAEHILVKGVEYLDDGNNCILVWDLLSTDWHPKQIVHYNDYFALDVDKRHIVEQSSFLDKLRSVKNTYLNTKDTFSRNSYATLKEQLQSFDGSNKQMLSDQIFFGLNASKAHELLRGSLSIQEAAELFALQDPDVLALFITELMLSKVTTVDLHTSQHISDWLDLVLSSGKIKEPKVIDIIEHMLFDEELRSINSHKALQVFLKRMASDIYSLDRMLSYADQIQERKKDPGLLNKPSIIAKTGVFLSSDLSGDLADEVIESLTAYLNEEKEIVSRISSHQNSDVFAHLDQKDRDELFELSSFQEMEVDERVEAIGNLKNLSKNTENKKLASKAIEIIAWYAFYDYSKQVRTIGKNAISELWNVSTISSLISLYKKSISKVKDTIFLFIIEHAHVKEDYSKKLISFISSVAENNLALFFKEHLKERDYGDGLQYISKTLQARRLSQEMLYNLKKLKDDNLLSEKDYVFLLIYFCIINDTGKNIEKFFPFTLSANDYAVLFSFIQRTKRNYEIRQISVNYFKYFPLDLLEMLVKDKDLFQQTLRILLSDPLGRESLQTMILYAGAVDIYIIDSIVATAKEILPEESINDPRTIELTGIFEKHLLIEPTALREHALMHLAKGIESVVNTEKSFRNTKKYGNSYPNELSGLTKILNDLYNDQGETLLKMLELMRLAAPQDFIYLRNLFHSPYKTAYIEPLVDLYLTSSNEAVQEKLVQVLITCNQDVVQKMLINSSDYETAERVSSYLKVYDASIQLPSHYTINDTKSIQDSQLANKQENISTKHGEIAQGYTEGEARSKKLEVRKDASGIITQIETDGITREVQPTASQLMILQIALNQISDLLPGPTKTTVKNAQVMIVSGNARAAHIANNAIVIDERMLECLPLLKMVLAHEVYHLLQNELLNSESSKELKNVFLNEFNALRFELQFFLKLDFDEQAQVFEALIKDDSIDSQEYWRTLAKILPQSFLRNIYKLLQERGHLTSNKELKRLMKLHRIFSTSVTSPIQETIDMYLRAYILKRGVYPASIRKEYAKYQADQQKMRDNELARKITLIEPISELKSYFTFYKTHSQPGEASYSNLHLFSNEGEGLTLPVKTLRKLSDKGVYLGASIDQNFSYASMVDPELVIILDINPLVTRVVLPVQGMMIKASPTRLEYLSLYCNQMIDPALIEESKTWSAADIINYIMSQESVDNDKVLTSLTKGFPEPIKTEARNYWRSFSSYNALLLNSSRMDLDGNHHHWLSSEDSYQKIRDLWLENKVFGVEGAWQGASLNKIADYLVENGLEISVMYSSNISNYAQKNLRDNMRGLPKTDNCIHLWSDVNFDLNWVIPEIWGVKNIFNIPEDRINPLWQISGVSYQRVLFYLYLWVVSESSYPSIPNTNLKNSVISEIDRFQHEITKRTQSVFPSDIMIQSLLHNHPNMLVYLKQLQQDYIKAFLSSLKEYLSLWAKSPFREGVLQVLGQLEVNIQLQSKTLFSTEFFDDIYDEYARSTILDEYIRKIQLLSEKQESGTGLSLSEIIEIVYVFHDFEKFLEDKIHVLNINMFFNTITDAHSVNEKTKDIIRQFIFLVGEDATNEQWQIFLKKNFPQFSKIRNLYVIVESIIASPQPPEGVFRDFNRLSPYTSSKQSEKAA